MPTNINNISSLNSQLSIDKLIINQRSLIQGFDVDFLWKVGLKILNSGIILKTFTHDIHTFNPGLNSQLSI